MRHGMNHRKFSRTSNQRKALLQNLSNALIERERILTTLPKAKDLRPVVEKLITKGRNNPNDHGFRLLKSRLGSDTSCKKIISDLGVRYKDRNGGYLRIVKAGFRLSDGASMAVIEFV